MVAETFEDAKQLLYQSICFISRLFEARTQNKFLDTNSSLTLSSYDMCIHHKLLKNYWIMDTSTLAYSVGDAGADS